MKAIAPHLISQWHSLLEPFLVQQELSQQVLSDLAIAYTNIGRYYHTLEHIEQVLATINSWRKTLSRAASLTSSPNYAAIEFAAWFHDVIYEPRAKDNEEKSAEYAIDVLKKINIPLETIDAVYYLILSTKNHQKPNNIEGKILLDADLSILGASSYDYMTYAQAIRKEYSWISNTEYQVGRKQILQSFLQRKRIYLTDEMFTTLESKARENIQSEIEFISTRQP